MATTVLTDAESESTDVQPGPRVRLRVNVLDALMVARGVRTVEAQAELFEINRTHWFHIRAGKVTPNLETGMRVALHAGALVEQIWEWMAEGPAPTHPPAGPSTPPPPSGPATPSKLRVGQAE